LSRLRTILFVWAFYKASLLGIVMDFFRIYMNMISVAKFIFLSIICLLLNSCTKKQAIYIRNLTTDTVTLHLPSNFSCSASYSTNIETIDTLLHSKLNNRLFCETAPNQTRFIRTLPHSTMMMTVYVRNRKINEKTLKARYTTFYQLNDITLHLNFGKNQYFFWYDIVKKK